MYQLKTALHGSWIANTCVKALCVIAFRPHTCHLHMYCANCDVRACRLGGFVVPALKECMNHQP